MEVIKITDTLTLKAVSVAFHFRCHGCYLDQFLTCSDIKMKHGLHCVPETRDDGLNVIFKKVDNEKT